MNIIQTGLLLKNIFGFSTYKNPMLPASTFAALPTASTVPGQTRIISDLNNCMVRSDGTYWNPVNGSAVIANAHNVNLTIQSLSHALITSVAFPAGFVRAGSRIRTWMRWKLPGVGTGTRVWAQYEGAVGAGSGGSTSRISNVTLVDYYVEWLQ